MVGRIGETRALQVIDFERKGLSLLTVWGLITAIGAGNAISAQVAAKRHGDYGCRLRFGGSGADNYFYEQIGNQDDFHLRLYFMLPSSFSCPDGNVQLAMIMDSGAALLLWADIVIAGATQKLYFLHGAWDGWGAADPGQVSIERDTWYCLEMHFKKDAAAGGSEVWLDDDLLFSHLTKDSSSVTPSGFIIGQQSGPIPTANSDLYVDDIVVDDERIYTYMKEGKGDPMKRYKGIWYLVAGDITETMFFKKVRWVSKGGTIGDECILKDENGEIIFHSVAANANWTDSFELDRMVKVTVDKLDAGELFLYE